MGNFTKWVNLDQVINDGEKHELDTAIAEEISKFQDGLAEAGDRVNVNVSSCCPHCYGVKKITCSTCRLLKEIILEYVWFEDFEERKVRRERFELVLPESSVTDAYRLRFPNNFINKNEQQKQEMSAETLPYFKYMLKLEHMVGRGTMRNQNVLHNGLDWWGKMIGAANEIILGIDTNETVKHLCPYRILKRLLTGGFINYLQEMDSATRDAFHKKQKKFFNFIIKYPHLWRKYVYADVRCTNWSKTPVAVGDSGKIFNWFNWTSKLAYFCIHENDWNSQEANEQFEQFLMEISNNNNNAEIENNNIEQYLGECQDEIKYFESLGHHLPESNPINSNYPGTKSGDFHFLIQMMIISLQCSSKEVDVEKSMRDDDDSDLRYNYPIELSNDPKLGSEKQKYYDEMKANIENGPVIDERCRCPLIYQPVDNNQILADFIASVENRIAQQKSKKPKKELSQEEKKKKQQRVRTENWKKKKGWIRRLGDRTGWTEEEKKKLKLLRLKTKRKIVRYWYDWKIPKFRDNNEPIIDEGWKRCDCEYSHHYVLRRHIRQQYAQQCRAILPKTKTLTKNQKEMRGKEVDKLFDHLYPANRALDYFHCNDCGYYRTKTTVLSTKNHLTICRKNYGLI